MANDSGTNKDAFLYPIGSYHGKFTPENIAFNANLQEFAQRVAILCALESGGKLSPEDTYHQVKDLWKQLKQSRDSLINSPPPPPVELPEE